MRVPTTPTVPIVDGIDAHPTKRPVRIIAGIASTPLLRIDGSIWDREGYDDQTGWLFDPRGETFPTINAKNIDAAADGRKRLLDLMSDFPFATDADFSVFLSMVLTPLARSLFHGPVPFHLIDANTSGAGKGLLFNVASLIAVGRILQGKSLSDEIEEQRKQMLAIGREGAPMLNFDNLESGSALGSRILDQVLTSATVSDRVLGTNDIETRPVLAVLCGTGNNIRVKADMGRRLLRTRLVSVVDQPETRKGFKYDIEGGYVRRNRPELVGCALSILASYLVAGKPDVGLSALGSYGDWSGLVRSAIVWSGGVDPVETMKTVQSETDTKRDELAAILDLFEYVAPDGEQITLKEFVERAKGDPIRYPEAADKFAEIGMREKPDELVKAFKSKFQKYKDTPLVGRSIRQSSDKAHGNVAKWYIARNPRHETVGL